MSVANDTDRVDWALTHALRAALWHARGATGLPRFPLGGALLDEVLREAERHRVDVLVAEGLSSLGTPQDLLALEERRHRALARALLLQSARQRVSSILDEARIPHLYLKGVLSDALYWGARGARGTSDLDLLVPRDRSQDAVVALAEIGVQEARYPRHRASIECGNARNLRWRTPAADVAIDVHAWLLSEPPFVDPSSEVLSEARTYETAGGAIRGPSPEHALLYLAGNLGSDGFSGRLKLALDAACLLLSGDVDVDRVRTGVRRWGCSAALWALLALVEARLGVVAPRGLLEQLQPGWARGAFLRRVVGVKRAPLPGLGAPVRAACAETPARALASLASFGVLRSVDVAGRLPLLDGVVERVTARARAPRGAGGSLAPGLRAAAERAR